MSTKPNQNKQKKKKKEKNYTKETKQIGLLLIRKIYNIQRLHLGKYDRSWMENQNFTTAI